MAVSIMKLQANSDIQTTIQNLFIDSCVSNLYVWGRVKY